MMIDDRMQKSRGRHCSLELKSFLKSLSRSIVRGGRLTNPGAGLLPVTNGVLEIVYIFFNVEDTTSDSVKLCSLFLCILRADYRMYNAPMSSSVTFSLSKTIAFTPTLSAKPLAKNARKQILQPPRPNQRQKDLLKAAYLCDNS